MLWEKIHVHHGLAGEIRDLVEARHLRHGRAPAHIDEDLRRFEQRFADLHLRRRYEAAVALKHRAAIQRFQRALHGVARGRDDRILARLHGFRVHRNRPPDDDTVVRMAPRGMRRIGARDQRLGGGAAIVHAGAAEVRALDHRNLAAGRDQPPRQRRPGLAGADDNGVELGHGGGSNERHRPNLCLHGIRCE
jgi:hypothetical protein